MKNNKGFTLIELLGTLIIITLLTAIVVPKILDWYNNSTDTYKELNEELIIESARMYVNDNPNTYLKDVAHTYCIRMETLVDKGYLEEKNVQGFDQETYVNTFVMAVNNSKYFEYYIVNSCTES